MQHSSGPVRYDLTARWTTLPGGVLVRRMIEGEGCSISLYQMPAGRRFELHQHPFAELGVVLAGRGNLLLEGGERALREGDSFYIPGGTPHGFQVPEGPVALLLNVTVPRIPGAVGTPAEELLRIAAETVREEAGKVPHRTTRADGHRRRGPRPTSPGGHSGG